MHLDYMIGSSNAEFTGLIRSYVDEPNADASDWTNPELIMYVNMEHRHLFSKVRNLYEDWFMRQYVFPLVTDQVTYTVPREMINPRKVEFLRASAVTGTSPNYVVNELTADPLTVEEVQLSGNGPSWVTTSQNRIVTTSGYMLFDDTIQFLSDSILGSNYYARIYYLPFAPDLHRALAAAGSSTTITFGTNGATTTVGNISAVDNYYQNMYIEIISGTGAGQLRRITQYAGSTKVATVGVAWATTPDATSVYSIVSPIKEDFQELLALGAAMRAKGIKTEDDTSAIAQMYGVLMDEMVNSLERRNQKPRRVNSTQRSNLWL